METPVTDGATEPPRPCKATVTLASVMSDPGPCEGPRDAVLLLSSVGTPSERERQLLGTRSCVHHGAQLYARLAYACVYSNGEEHDGAASEVYRRAVAIAQLNADAHARAALDYFGGKAAA